MPIKIDCPDCDGLNYKTFSTGIKEEHPFNLKCTTCKNGKITVYTQEELNKAVKEKMEEYALMFEDYADSVANQRQGTRNMMAIGKVHAAEHCANLLRNRKE